MLSESLLPSSSDSRRNAYVAYATLGASICFEVLGTMCMRMANENAFWRVGAYGAYAVAFSLLPFSLETISLSVAYATWSALGTLFVVLLSRCFFGETLKATQVMGVIGTVVSVAFLHIEDLDTMFTPTQ